jgi:MFS family permease
VRGVRDAYRRVLRNRPLTRLLLGEFVSGVGDWLYLVALLIILYERTNDAVLLGIVGAARVLPYVFLSIPAGIAADRLDRRLVLLATDLARGACMLVLAYLAAVGGSIEAIVAVTILATCFSAFFGPAIGSYLPSLVADERDLGPANTAYAMLDNVAFIVGPALAALLLSVSGLTAAFVLNAASFAFIAAILWRLPPSRAGGYQAAPAATAPLATDAEATTSTHPSADDRAADAPPEQLPLRRLAVPVGGLLLFDLVTSFVFGGLAILTVVIAYDLLGAGEEGTGALNAAVGVGGLVGAVLSGALVLRRRLAPPLLFGAVSMALSVAILGQSGSLGVAMLAMGVASMGSLLVTIVGETLFQRIVPDAIRGRALGVLATVGVLVYALGSFALPAAAEGFGLGPVLLASGAAIIVAAVAAVAILGPWAIQAPPEDALRATISQVSSFAGIAPANLETAERRASIVRVVPGQVIIRQGDAADRYYVIAEGEVEVTRTEQPGAEPMVLRRMGPREGFGEIGLLTGFPRTATVTARAPGVLLALDGPDFLELVGSGAGVSFPLLDLHRGAVAGSGQLAASGTPAGPG